MKTRAQRVEDAWVRWKNQPAVAERMADPVMRDYLRAAFFVGAYAGRRAQKAWEQIQIVKRQKGARRDG